jgi:hypothetical protein
MSNYKPPTEESLKNLKNLIRNLEVDEKLRKTIVRPKKLKDLTDYGPEDPAFLEYNISLATSELN